MVFAVVLRGSIVEVFASHSEAVRFAGRDRKYQIETILV